MSTREAFWKHVNEALDERRDPLDDENVQRLVAEAPELLREVSRLESGLERASRERPRRSLVGAVAAALLVVSLATWLLARHSPDAASIVAIENSGVGPAVREQSVSRVLSFELSVSRVGERGTETITCDGFERSRTLVARDGSVVRNTIHLANAPTRDDKP